MQGTSFLAGVGVALFMLLVFWWLIRRVRLTPEQQEQLAKRQEAERQHELKEQSRRRKAIVQVANSPYTSFMRCGGCDTELNTSDYARYPGTPWILCPNCARWVCRVDSNTVVTSKYGEPKPTLHDIRWWVAARAGRLERYQDAKLERFVLQDMASLAPLEYVPEFQERIDELDAEIEEARAEWPEEEKPPEEEVPAFAEVDVADEWQARVAQLQLADETEES